MPSLSFCCTPPLPSVGLSIWMGRGCQHFGSTGMSYRTSLVRVRSCCFVVVSVVVVVVVDVGVVDVVVDVVVASPFLLQLVCSSFVRAAWMTKWRQWCRRLVAGLLRGWLAANQLDGVEVLTAWPGADGSGSSAGSSSGDDNDEGVAGGIDSDGDCRLARPPKRLRRGEITHAFP